MKEQILTKIKEIDNNLNVYQEFLKTASEDDKKVVSYKVLHDMIAFSIYKELVPDYVPTVETNFALTAGGLNNLANYVSVIDDKVVISEEYKSVVKQQREFLKSKNN